MVNDFANQGRLKKKQSGSSTGKKSRLLETICDSANLAVGAGLFVSPWILGFGAGPPNVETQSVGVSGAFIGVLSFAALYAFEIWEERLILIVAAGALVSPWIFGFAGTTAMMVLLCGGTLSILLAATRLHLWSRLPSRATSQQLTVHASGPDPTLSQSTSANSDLLFKDRPASDVRRHTARSPRGSEALVSPTP